MRSSSSFTVAPLWSFAAYACSSVNAFAKTPEPILATINKAVVQAVQSASFKQKIAAVGLNPQAAASAVQDHAAWRAEYERLAATLKRFDIRAPD